jgi:hypothetical protein
MSWGRTVRRTVTGLAVVTAGGFAAMHPAAVRAFYLDIYPSDPAKAEALNLCFAERHTFNRLDPGEREECYSHILQSLGAVSSASIAGPAPNAIDLKRSAGQGGMPKNDVRREEETQSASQLTR